MNGNDVAGRLKRAVLGIALMCYATLGLCSEPLKVVASFSILGDLVHQVGGARVTVNVLLGPNEDAHAFQPRPSDAKLIGDAHLVVANGLGFDDWMIRLAKSAGYRGAIIVASEGIKPLGEASDRGQHIHHNSGGIDPHAWQDVANVRRYVSNIASALIEADPAGEAVYKKNVERYDEVLKKLDEEIRFKIKQLPPERRKVVSSHDAFAYFAHAYAITFLAPVGVSNDAEPSAQSVARLIRQIKEEKVPALFLETVVDGRLLERIQAESGARIGGTLYSDALSTPSGPAPDYVSMMRHNVQVLVDVLSPGH